MDRPTLIPCRCVVWRVLGDDDDTPTLVADGVDFHPARFDTGVDADDLAHAALKYGEPDGWVVTWEEPGLYAPATDVLTEADRLEDCPMPERTNPERAEQVQALLSEYGNGDTMDDLTDLLTDALHLVGLNAMLRALRSAFMHYEAEAGVDVDWSIVPLPERTP